ncbi:MAG: PadR family transcriptional regulator [Chloroflexota bacterium]
MSSRPLTIELALLGLLRSGPAHGYQLHEQLQDPDGLGAAWGMKQAQLYALLDKLEELGYLSSTLQAQETRPARRMFELTASGRQAFERWLAEPTPRPRRLRQEFLAKLFFTRQHGASAVARLVDAQLLACQGWLADEQAALDRCPPGAFSRLVHEFRLGQLHAMHAWLAGCRSPDSPAGNT